VSPAASRHAEAADQPEHALLDEKQFVMPKFDPKDALAHNELDDVPDDFRV